LSPKGVCGSVHSRGPFHGFDQCAREGVVSAPPLRVSGP
jgi:hypothetical protein